MQVKIEKEKMKIIIIAASAFVLLIGIIITVACLNSAKDNDEGFYDNDSDDSIGAFAGMESTSATLGKLPQNSTSPSNEPYSTLAFESNGDGSCTIVGIGTYSGQELILPAENSKGETVNAISDGAFEGCTTLKIITIPATVKSIGSGVFVGCSSLESITVNSSNTKYCSVGGVLLSKNKTELICYPAMKVGKNYLLSTNIQKISTYAFDGIVNLKNIYYEGSASRYQSIEVGIGNQAFSALSVTCNYVPAK